MVCEGFQAKIPDKVNYYQFLHVGYSSVGLEHLIVVQEVAGSTPVSHQSDVFTELGRLYGEMAELVDCVGLENRST